MCQKRPTHRSAWTSIGGLFLIALLTACAAGDSVISPAPSVVVPATPASEVFQVNGVAPEGPRLRVTIPLVTLLTAAGDQPVQLFLVLADPQGTYSYLVYPANRPGDPVNQFDLSLWPLEVSLESDSSQVLLWAVALSTLRYEATEHYGLQALAASLGLGFRQWAGGDQADDPLAAIVSASAGALYEWFASTDVLGQTIVVFRAADNWGTGIASERSSGGKLNLVFDATVLSATEVTQLPTPSPAPSTPPGLGASEYVLVAEEDFSGGKSQLKWYEGQDRTFSNQLVDGAYEIRLTEIVQRDYALSWGSIENARFADYRVEAEVSLVEEGVQQGRYGLWFHYQDDFNFIYFGLSNEGSYRVAVILRNGNRREVQDWTPHPAIRPGAATNTLTIEASVTGEIALSINGERVATFTDRTFSAGSLAFFCYAQSVPTTCRLEQLRIWERRAS